MDTEVSNISIQIDAISDNAQAKIDSITDSLNNLKSAGIANINVSVSGTENVQNEIDSIQPKDDVQIHVNSSDVTSIRERIDNLNVKLQHLDSKVTKPKVDSRDLDEANSKASKLSNLLGSVGRIAKYRLIRWALRQVTEAFSEGLESAYEYSKLTGGELSQSLDRLATASNQMSNQLGAAFGQLLIAAEPVLLRLIELTTDFADGLTKLIATVSGKETVQVAQSVPVAWKETTKETNKATGAAKKYMKTLLGIDEINKLNDQSGGGGGGGTSGINANGLDTSSLFKTEPTSFTWKDFFKMLPFGLIIGGLLGLKALWKKLKEKVKEKTKEAKEKLKEKVKEIGEVSLEAGRGVVGQLKSLLDIVLPFPSLETEKTKAQATSILEQVEMVFNKIKSLVNEPYSATVSVLVPDFAHQAIQSLSKTINTFLSKSPFIAKASLEVEDPQYKLNKVTQAVANFAANTFSYFYNLSASTSEMLSSITENAIIEQTNAAGIMARLFGNVSESIIKNCDISLSAIQEWAIGVRNALDFSKEKPQLESSNKLAQLLNTAKSLVSSFSSSLSKIFDTSSYKDYSLGATNYKNYSWERATKSQTEYPAASYTYPSSEMAAAQAIIGAVGYQQKIEEAFADAYGPIRNSLNQGFSLFVEGLNRFAIPASIAWNAAALFPLPAYASGGFPEDGMFFANRGELVGKFSNGRTAVANNEQITEGIYEATRDANEDLISVVQQGFSAIISAIEGNGSGDIDGAARLLYPYIKNMQTLEGNSFV